MRVRFGVVHEALVASGTFCGVVAAAVAEVLASFALGHALQLEGEDVLGRATELADIALGTA